MLSEKRQNTLSNIPNCSQRSAVQDVLNDIIISRNLVSNWYKSMRIY
jgi:hypothetical protein